MEYLISHGLLELDELLSLCSVSRATKLHCLEHLQSKIRRELNEPSITLDPNNPRMMRYLLDQNGVLYNSNFDDDDFAIVFERVVQADNPEVIDMIMNVSRLDPWRMAQIAHQSIFGW